MSLIKCYTRDLDPLHNADDKDYLELMHSEAAFNGMNALNPFVFAMTPHEGNWLPFKNGYNSLECKFSYRIWRVFQKFIGGR